MENKPVKVRNYQMDNIRFILIMCVVCGHLTEVSAGGTNRMIMYYVLNSITIPALLFVTGYYARFNIAKMLKHFAFPYMVFHLIYTVYDCYVLHRTETLVIQFTTPYWLMWFMMSIFFCYMAIPALKVESKKQATLVLIATLIVSLAAGYEPTVGYYMSMSRTISYFPFFVAGYYMNNVYKPGEAFAKVAKYRIPIGIGLVIVALGSAYFMFLQKYPLVLFYGANSYAAANVHRIGALLRLEFFVVAVIWLAGFMCIIPSKKIPVLTTIGQNTLAIYLLHGFIVRYPLTKVFLSQFSPNVNLLMAFVLGSVVALLLGNKWVGKAFSKIF